MFLTRLFISSLSLGVAAYLVRGIYIDSLMTLIISAFLLGIVNAVIRPVLFVLTLPISILTLGIFVLILNALMLGLVAFLMPGFTIDSLGAAFWGWLILSITSWIGSKVFIDKKKRN